MIQFFASVVQYIIKHLFYETASSTLFGSHKRDVTSLVKVHREHSPRILHANLCHAYSACGVTLSIPGGRRGWVILASPLGFFLDNSNTLQDNEMKIFHFNLTPLRPISHILTMLIVLRCCHGNLLFQVCHIIFWDGKMKKLEQHSR